MKQADRNAKNKNNEEAMGEEEGNIVIENMQGRCFSTYLPVTHKNNINHKYSTFNYSYSIKRKPIKYHYKTMDCITALKQ